MSEKKLSERLRDTIDSGPWIHHHSYMEKLMPFIAEVEALECLLAKEIEYAKRRERKIAGLRQRL